MNRPGPVPLVIVLVFAIVFAVEFRTLLSMVGVDVDASVYFPVAAVLIAVAFAALLLLPGGDDEGPDRGNASKA